MKKLEDFIKDNREEFDYGIPSPKVWDAIENRLEKKGRRGFIFLRYASAVAAVFVLAIVGTYIIRNQGNDYHRYANVSDPEMRNLLETEAFYSRKVSTKINEIQKCYQVYPELKVDIEQDLNELDNMYRDLQNDLRENIYNREVIEAMIQNNRLKLEMVDKVLSQINC